MPRQQSQRLSLSKFLDLGLFRLLPLRLFRLLRLTRGISGQIALFRLTRRS
jgi:hypothetical protein